LAHQDRAQSRVPHGVTVRRFKIGGAWHTTREEIVRWSQALTMLARPETTETVPVAFPLACALRGSTELND
jgi:hypothetical protein